MRDIVAAILCFSFVFSACSSAKKNAATIYAAGDKAVAGQLTYNLIDAERMQQLGDDAATARTAKERFYLIKVSVSNSGTEETPVPAMTLIDDSGQTYNELSDGTGVPNWLGVVRKVGPAQTETGYVVFDAAPHHYRLRINDPFDEKEISIDVPLAFVRDANRSPAGSAPSTPSPADAPLDLQKK